MSTSASQVKTRLSSNITWNFVSGIASIFGLLLLYPLSVKIAGSEAYGIWVLAFGAIQLFTLADFGLGTGIVRTLSKIKAGGQGDVARRQFVTVSGTLFTALSVILTLLCGVLFPSYLQLVSMSDELRELVPLVVSVATGSLFLAVLGRFANSTLWAEDRPDIERKASLVGLAVRACGLFFGLLAGYDVIFVIWVEAVSIAVPSVVCISAVVRRYGWPSFNRECFKNHASPLMRISGVLFIGTFTSVAASQLPLYIIGGSLGLTATTAFGALIRVFQSSKLAISWLTNPFTHAIVNETSSAKIAGNAAKKCFLLTIVAALLISIPMIVLPSQILSAWMGEGFTFAAPSLALIAVAVLSNALILPSALISTLRSNPWPTALLGVVVLILTLIGVWLGAQSGSIHWATIGLVAPLALTAPAYVLVADSNLNFRLNGRSTAHLASLIGSALTLAAITFLLSEVMAPPLIVVTYALLAALAGAFGFVVTKRLRTRKK